MDIPPQQRSWARFFGLDAATLATPGLHLIPHAALRGYHGLWIFQHGSAVIISLPEMCMPMATALTGIHDLASGVAAIRTVVADRIAREIGPVFQGHATPDEFTPRPGPTTTRLSRNNAADLAHLAAACGAEAWEHGDLAVDGSDAHLFGCFRAGRLVAAGKHGPLVDGAFSDLGVVTHPAHRGHGFGAAVASAAMADGFSLGGQVAMYQTLEANHPAVAVARALGIRQHACHVAMRLR